ncbi:MAG: DNA-directed RNA polymerase subunit omega [Alphaproteobacteria bacterium]|nr:DNA-directed RNA polymerase subunit omega [Alphaproteobacteria bacterium]
MARVTVEDCIDKIPNRYDLVLVAAQRAKDISSGSPIQVDRDNDKNSVVALREISENRVSIEDLQRSLVMGQQKFVEVEEPEDEEIEIISAEKELAALDSQFSSDMISDEDLNNTMQIHGDDEDEDLDLDSEADEIDFDDGADFEDDAFDDMDDIE